MLDLCSCRRALACAIFPAVLALSACAAAPAPYHVRYADLAHGAIVGYDGKRALVLELAAGERIPVNLELDGEDFALAPEHPSLEVVAKRHCFVRFSSDGIRSSLDGEHFDEKPRVPGRFRIGLTSNRGEQTRLDVILATPRR